MIYVYFDNKFIFLFEENVIVFICLIFIIRCVLKDRFGKNF